MTSNGILQGRHRIYLEGVLWRIFEKKFLEMGCIEFLKKNFWKWNAFICVYIFPLVLCN
jgi:hypothetical protein